MNQAKLGRRGRARGERRWIADADQTVRSRVALRQRLRSRIAPHAGEPDAHPAAPIPKIIDVGVAKAISHTLTDKTIFTEQGMIIGTPEYMSPEQAEMGAVDVDTRTDVYSLGVVIYELLTGALPFGTSTLRAAAHNEIQRIIRETDPPRPSTRLSRLGKDAEEVARLRQTSLDLLRRQLKGELEWIPLKAMHKERARRYASMTELADDMQNYLAEMGAWVTVISDSLKITPPTTGLNWHSDGPSRSTFVITFDFATARCTAAETLTLVSTMQPIMHSIPYIPQMSAM